MHIAHVYNRVQTIIGYAGKFCNICQKNEEFDCNLSDGNDNHMTIMIYRPNNRLTDIGKLIMIIVIIIIIMMIIIIIIIIKIIIIIMIIIMI